MICVIGITSLHILMAISSFLPYLWMTEMVRNVLHTYVQEVVTSLNFVPLLDLGHHFDTIFWLGPYFWISNIIMELWLYWLIGPSIEH